jgi:hypothetical protein
MLASASVAVAFLLFGPRAMGHLPPALCSLLSALCSLLSAGKPKALLSWSEAFSVLFPSA